MARSFFEQVLDFILQDLVIKSKVLLTNSNDASHEKMQGS